MNEKMQQLTARLVAAYKTDSMLGAEIDVLRDRLATVSKQRTELYVELEAAQDAVLDYIVSDEFASAETLAASANGELE